MKFYCYELDIKVVGIIGSNGKIIVKDMVKVVFDIIYCVLKIDGNFNNYIGMLFIILCLDEIYDIVVLEMGMSSWGEIEFFFNLVEFDVVIIINIGELYF